MADPNTTGAAGSLSAIIGAAVLGGLLVAAAVAFVMLRGGPEDAAPTEVPLTVVTEPPTGAPGVDRTEEAPAPPETPEVAAGDPAAPVLPRFDLVRVDPAGSAVIAGQAASLAEVTLALDGDPVQTVTADAAGQFVAMLALTPSDRPRLLSLQAVLPGGVAVGGDQTVMIAPLQGEALAARAVDPVMPPDPPPATRALPPGVGEATSAAPQLGAGAVDDALAAPGATALASVAPDAAPVAQTDPGAAPVTETASDAQPLGGTAQPVFDITAPQTPQSMPQVPQSAPQGPAVLLADSEGVRVLQGAAAPPEVMTEVQLDAITYNAAGEVTLAGRGPADASVQVTLNNRPINLGEIGPGGQWSLGLPDVDPGTYTLRLDQVDADGTVTLGLESPFLREDPVRIRDNPMLVADGASVITVQRGFTLWGIAEANFGDGIRYVQIFEENRDAIRNPDLIFPGQIFALPDLPRGGADQ